MPAIGSISAAELQAHNDAGKIECDLCHRMVCGFSLKRGLRLCPDCVRDNNGEDDQ